MVEPMATPVAAPTGVGSLRMRTQTSSTAMSTTVASAPTWRLRAAQERRTRWTTARNDERPWAIPPGHAADVFSPWTSPRRASRGPPAAASGGRHRRVPPPPGVRRPGVPAPAPTAADMASATARADAPATAARPRSRESTGSRGRREAARGGWGGEAARRWRPVPAGARSADSSARACPSCSRARRLRGARAGVRGRLGACGTAGSSTRASAGAGRASGGRTERSETLGPGAAPSCRRVDEPPR